MKQSFEQANKVINKKFNVPKSIRGMDSKLIKPEDLINRYTAISGGSISPMTFDGGYIADITIQSAFHTVQECHEWEHNFKQFILENR